MLNRDYPTKKTQKTPFPTPKHRKIYNPTSFSKLSRVIPQLIDRRRHSQRSLSLLILFHKLHHISLQVIDLTLML